MAGKRPTQLSDSFVYEVAQPGSYTDVSGGHGLSLMVQRTSDGQWSKTWSQRIRIKGQMTGIGLGSFPVVSLAMARERALRNAQCVARGEDPRTSGPVIPTVAEAFEQTIAARASAWSGRSTEAAWRRSLQYSNEMSSKLVSEVTPSDVIRVLAPLWHAKNRIARDVRSHLSAVMQLAITLEYRTTNPAGPSVTGQLGKATPPVHHTALHYNDLGQALAIVRDSDAWWAEKCCLIFLAITCVRSIAAREADWDEIDLDVGTWTIPAERVKGRIAHQVPLPDQAIEILLYAEEQSAGRQGTLFPPKLGGRFMRAERLSGLLRRLWVPCTPHGFRTSFITWAREMPHIADELAEAALAHQQRPAFGGVHIHGSYFGARRPIMQEWADFLTETMGPVVPSDSCGSD